MIIPIVELIEDVAVIVILGVIDCEKVLSNVILLDIVDDTDGRINGIEVVLIDELGVLDEDIELLLDVDVLGVIEEDLVPVIEGEPDFDISLEGVGEEDPLLDPLLLLDVVGETYSEIVGVRVFEFDATGSIEFDKVILIEIELDFDFDDTLDEVILCVLVGEFDEEDDGVIEEDLLALIVGLLEGVLLGVLEKDALGDAVADWEFVPVILKLLVTDGVSAILEVPVFDAVLVLDGDAEVVRILLFDRELVTDCEIEVLILFEIELVTLIVGDNVGTTL